VAAAVICLGILVAENDAEQVDSGWAVAPLPPIARSAKHGDPRHKATLHNLLQQTQTPLLPTAPHVAASLRNVDETKNDSSKNIDTTKSTVPAPSVRFAVRPDGIDGWRPAGQPAAPLNGPSKSQVTAPLLSAPYNDEPADDTNEAPSTPANPATTGEEHIDQQTSDEAAEFDCQGEAAIAPEQTSPSASDKQEVAVESDTTLEADAAAGSLEDTYASDPTEPMVPADVAPPADTVESNESTKPIDRAPETEVAAPRLLDTPEVGPLSDDEAQPPKLIPKVAKSPPPLTKQLTSLRTKLRAVLKGYYRKQLNSRDNDPWEVMHGMLAYGVHSRIRQGGPRGAPVTSVGWLCYNKPCKNLNLLYVNPKGEVRAKYGVGLQGHLGQLLAMLAQCRVSEEYPIHVGKREFTIKDLIESEKKTCYPKSELTFKLIAFQYYLDLNDTWVNDQGVEFDIPRVIREELAQPIRGAACGGTHRLSSLSLTVKQRLRRGEPLDGEYARAAAFVEKYHQYALRLQNRDGSLSTDWFRGRGDDSDINRRIKTTGHILEWLCYSLSDEQLREPKTIAAVTYLTNLMYSNYDNEWEVGPMSHATHALLLYDERVFQPFDNAEYNATYKPKSRPSSTRRNTPTRSSVR
jgi:hypothetical protein